MSKTEEVMEKILELHVRHELELYRAGNRRQAIESELQRTFRSEAALDLGQAISAEQFQDLNWMLVRLGLRSAGSEMVKKRLFVEILEQKPEVFKFSLDRMISGDRAKQAIQASLKLENLRKELIRTAVYNPFFAQFLSDVLYNGIKGFLAEGNLGKDIPLAGNLMRAGQALLGKAMEGLEGNFEKPIKEFIRKNIDSTMHHTEKMLYTAFEGEEFTETAYQIYQDWASRELGSMLELVTKEEYAAAVECLADWPEFLLDSREFQSLIRGAALAFFESRKETDLGTLLSEHGVEPENESLPAVLSVLFHSLERWQDEAGILEQSIRNRLEAFYGAQGTRDAIESLL